MDWVPHINWVHPPEERAAAHHLVMQIHMVSYQEDQFRSAIELLTHVSLQIEAMKANGGPGNELADRARVANWANIAGTYAAISLSNFRDCLFALRHAAGQCQTRKGLIDFKLLEDMPRRFDEAFPIYKAVRDHAVHFIDKMFTPEKIQGHRSPDEPFIHGTMMGNALVFTVEGRRVELAVTAENLAKLSEIRRETHEAFRKLSAL